MFGHPALGLLPLQFLENTLGLFKVRSAHASQLRPLACLLAVLCKVYKPLTAYTDGHIFNNIPLRIPDEQFQSSELGRRMQRVPYVIAIAVRLTTPRVSHSEIHGCAKSKPITN